jgi:hypothetical protein
MAIPSLSISISLVTLMIIPCVPDLSLGRLG